MPKWFSGIKDELTVQHGGSGADHSWSFGTPVDVLNEPMKVRVDFGKLSNATYYDEETNSINVDQSRLLPNETGYFGIVITASCIDQSGKEFDAFKKSIYLYIEKVVEEEVI